MYLIGTRRSTLAVICDPNSSLGVCANVVLLEVCTLSQDSFSGIFEIFLQLHLVTGTPLVLSANGMVKGGALGDGYCFWFHMELSINILLLLSLIFPIS